MKEIRYIRENDMFDWEVGDIRPINVDGLTKVIFRDGLACTFPAIKLVEKGYAEYVQDKKFGEIERVPQNGTYYYFCNDGYISSTSDMGVPSDIESHGFGNYFHTEKQALQASKEIKAYLKIRRWIDDANASITHGKWSGKWYTPAYCSKLDKFITEYDIHRKPIFSLLSVEHCDQLTEELEPELRILFRCEK